MIKKKKSHWEKAAGAPSRDKMELTEEMKQFIRHKVQHGFKSAKKKYVDTYKTVSDYQVRHWPKEKTYQTYEAAWQERWDLAKLTRSSELIKQAQIASLKALTDRFEEKIAKGEPQYVMDSKTLIEFFNYLTSLTVIDPVEEDPIEDLQIPYDAKPLIEDNEDEYFEGADQTEKEN